MQQQQHLLLAYFSARVFLISRGNTHRARVSPSGVRWPFSNPPTPNPGLGGTEICQGNTLIFRWILNEIKETRCARELFWDMLRKNRIKLSCAPPFLFRLVWICTWKYFQNMCSRDWILKQKYCLFGRKFYSFCVMILQRAWNLSEVKDSYEFFTKFFKIIMILYFLMTLWPLSHTLCAINSLNFLKILNLRVH